LPPKLDHRRKKFTESLWKVRLQIGSIKGILMRLGTDSSRQFGMLTFTSASHMQWFC